MAEDAARTSPTLGVMTLAAIMVYLMPLPRSTYSDASGRACRPRYERGRLCAERLDVGGSAGAGAATALNVRWGRTIPISGFFVGFALVVLVLCLSRNPTAYVIALAASVVIYYFYDVLVRLTPLRSIAVGHWGGGGGIAYLLGFAAGPVFAGVGSRGRLRRPGRRLRRNHRRRMGLHHGRLPAPRRDGRPRTTRQPLRVMRPSERDAR